MTPSEADSDAFWRWFLSVEGQLAERLTNDEILSELDTRVRGFGNLTWEVGPGREKPCWLVISGGGDTGDEAIAKAVVARRPEMARWEVYVSRPPKGWLPKFYLHRGGEQFDIDASGWRYVLLKYPDGTFDLDVWAEDLAALDDDLRRHAVNVALDNLLGEERRNALIVDVTIACDAGTRPEQTIAFERLSDHLISLTRN